MNKNTSTSSELNRQAAEFFEYMYGPASLIVDAAIRNVVANTPLKKDKQATITKLRSAKENLCLAITILQIAKLDLLEVSFLNKLHKTELRKLLATIQKLRSCLERIDPIVARTIGDHLKVESIEYDLLTSNILDNLAVLESGVSDTTTNIKVHMRRTGKTKGGRPKYSEQALSLARRTADALLKSGINPSYYDGNVFVVLLSELGSQIDLGIKDYKALARAGLESRTDDSDEDYRAWLNERLNRSS